MKTDMKLIQKEVALICQSCLLELDFLALIVWTGASALNYKYPADSPRMRNESRSFNTTGATWQQPAFLCRFCVAGDTQTSSQIK